VQAAPNATIRVKASRLQPYHRVVLNDTELETRFVSQTELEAKLPPKTIKHPGIYRVAVVSPGEFNARSSPTALIVTFAEP
jgi:hypothetical protein